jgi:hypothetical protein
MTSVTETGLQSFVLLRLGERRFALPASKVAELIAPSRIFRFPHKSPALEGVILRRGRMIAVCDIAEQLTGKTPRCAPIQPARYTQVRRSTGLDCHSRQRRMRTHQCGCDASWRQRLAPRRRLAFARRRSHRSTSSICPYAWPDRDVVARAIEGLRGGSVMMLAGRPAKILLIDTNVYFSKRPERRSEARRL